MTLEEKIEFRALKQNYSLLEMRITALETAMNQEYVTPKRTCQNPKLLFKQYLPQDTTGKNKRNPSRQKLPDTHEPVPCPV